jgi:hypothetical protein
MWNIHQEKIFFNFNIQSVVDTKQDQIMKKGDQNFVSCCTRRGILAFG